MECDMHQNYTHGSIYISAGWTRNLELFYAINGELTGANGRVWNAMLWGFDGQIGLF